MMSRKYKIQLEQVSVMNKLLNDALRAKGYAGPDIKMVLTDVTDPNEPFYTDTLTNVVVFDRKQLANLDRDKILNALGHEFGHYSKEDDIDKSQEIANHTGELLENRIKDMVAKEATEDTLAAIRNNPNVITGEEGKTAKIEFGVSAFGVGIGGEINGKDEVSVSAKSEETSLKLMLKLGYIGVEKWELSEKVKKLIKKVTNNPERTAENIEAVKTIITELRTLQKENDDINEKSKK